MVGRKRREVPARLSRLQQRFAAWRRTRAPGERIPDALWKSAAKLAADYGLNQTATLLKLDYYSLKEHKDRWESVARSLTAKHAAFEQAAGFVEVSPPLRSTASECVIEFTDGTGASMRVHLKGCDVPDVLALGRNFWNAQ